MWTTRATFRGDTTSLLFALLPKFKVYRASGMSQNNLWLYNNRSNRAGLPIGLGFGGQISHFRLWIDEDLMNGKASPFGLAYHPSTGSLIDADTEEEFKIDRLEVWGCGGTTAEQHQVAAKAHQAREVEKRRKVNRAQLGDGWESGADKFIMDLAGKTGAADAFLEDVAKIKQIKKDKEAQEKKLQREKEEQITGVKKSESDDSQND